ncbi:hypothetical protein C8K36_10970 [Rhodococcus sp. OK519]|uniref:hypothetical protein n=1 Tax=Rhodococcus sp. OK519 TaxID=2135729 RepID=UPI000D3D4ABE|nr:hypothetical protein C8K36_10970 [Rhodococcus sp. OK519]
MAKTPLAANITDGTAGHANLHNEERTRINTVANDTGWVDIKSKLANGWTANNIFIRRVGKVVSLRVSGLTGAAATATQVMPAQTGYWAPNNLCFPAFGESGGTMTQFKVQPAGIALNQSAILHSDNQMFTWLVDDDAAWPA